MIRHGILKTHSFWRTLKLRAQIALSFVLFFFWPMICGAQWQAQNILTQNSGYNFRVRTEDSECKPLIAKNETNAQITIEKLESGHLAECFQLNDTIHLPHRLAPGESVIIGFVCFRPKIANKEYEANINVIVTPGQPTIRTVHFHGASFAEAHVENIPPTAPGAMLAFDPVTMKEGALISMVGKDQQFMRSYSFKNTSQAAVTVTEVDFQNHDQRFDITSIEPGGSLPIEIAPGESFSLRISYSSFDRVPFYNRLLISTEQSKKPLQYEVRGFQLPLSEMEWNKKEKETHPK